MTDVSKLEPLAKAISTSSSRIRAYAIEQARVSAEQEERLRKLEAPAPAPPAGARLFAFSNGGRYSSDAELLQGLTIGVNALRVDIQWSWAPVDASGNYDLGKQVALANLCRSVGVEWIPCIAYTPARYRPAGTDDKHEPNAEGELEYARFAALCAKTLHPLGVKKLEIWNEANISGFWKPKPNPAKYARMLKAAYQQIKVVVPQMEVMTVGMSPAGSYTSRPLGGVDVNPVAYLEEIYRLGVGGHFDSVGHHPYDHNGGSGGYHEASAWSQMQDTPKSLRSLMVANGDGAKKIHVTEFGLPSANQDQTWFTGTEAKQADWIRNAVTKWKSYSWAGDFCVYLQRDNMNGGSGNWFSTYGLVRSDNTFKPAWISYRDAIKGS